MSAKPRNPFVGDPSAKAVGPGRAGPKQKSEATGRFIPCTGNHFVGAHPPVFIQLIQGPRCLHSRCPISDCRLQSLYHGAGWRNVGVTREEAMRLVPNCVFG